MILFIIYAVITRSVSRRLKVAGISGEARTGIAILLRFFFVVVATILITNAFGPDLGVLVSLSTPVDAALGVTVAQAVYKMITRIYILMARPFRVGD